MISSYRVPSVCINLSCNCITYRYESPVKSTEMQVYTRIFLRVIYGNFTSATDNLAGIPDLTAALTVKRRAVKDYNNVSVRR